MFTLRIHIKKNFVQYIYIYKYLSTVNINEYAIGDDSA